MTERSGRFLPLPELADGGASIKVLQPDRLMECFEGLGDGCEFGNAQRFCGIEPLGLLRFAAVPYGALLEMLESRFAALPPDQTSLRLLPNGHDREWWAGIDQCGMYYHTGRRIGEIAEDTLKGFEIAKIKFLKRKMLEELEAPEVIFVRRDPWRRVEEIRHAHGRLNQYGPQSLLWICRAPRPDMVGEIEVLEAGLVRGFISDTAQDAAPPPAALAVWLTLLEKTLKILKPGVAEILKKLPQPENLALMTPVWRQSAFAETRASDEVPRLPFQRQIAKHTLIADTDWGRCEAVSFGVTGLAPERLYTVSAWVWLPAGFVGAVSLVFPGTQAIKDWPADPAKTGCWQRIVTSVRLPEGLDHHFPSLWIVGAKGTYVYSTGWRFDHGACPGDCYDGA
jgi:hypothetical protein